jgi:hypothetical protein
MALAALTIAPLAPALAAAAEKEPPAAAVAEALAEVVRIRHGKHLDAEQRKAVTTSILRNQLAAERLRDFKLQNGDEPAFTFRADLP